MDRRLRKPPVRIFTPVRRRHFPKRELFSEHVTIDDVLVSEVGLDPRELIEARVKSREKNVSLGDVLIASGRLSQVDYHRALARTAAMPFANLEDDLPPRELLRAEHIDDYLRGRILPIAETQDGVQFVSADQGRLEGAAARERLSKRYPRATQPTAMTSPRDVRNVVLKRFPKALSERATLALANAAPELSARLPVTRGQIRALAILLLCLVVVALIWPTVALVGVNIFFAVVFLSTIGLRAIAFLNRPQWRRRKPPDPSLRTPEHDLPVYSIVVPLYREERMLPHLAMALLHLDYPQEKLDIKFVFEADDHETLAAARALRLPANFEFLVAPRTEPRTKPKALNFALPFARGEFLVIFDAEDRPEPGQLRAALKTFAAAPPEVVCLQARLAFYNAGENWLTRQFAIEYATLFDLTLPALDRLGLPILLGGTSNHFRMAALRAVHSWDPHNVTEDADLGIRLRRLGYRASVLDSDTLEEASCTLGGWLRQRSRWLKGWMQTWFVHMRQPMRLRRELGTGGFLAFQALLAGVVLSALVYPWFFVAIPYALASGLFAESLASWPGFALGMLNSAVLISGVGVAMLAGFLALRARLLDRLAGQVLFIPVYWLLISLGAYMALWQFITRPFYWEKTEHGLRRVFRS